MIITVSDQCLTLGVKCKACDCGLSADEVDPELCGVCMWWVTDYNKDIDKPDKYEDDDIDFLEDEAFVTLEEWENAILTGEVSS